MKARTGYFVAGILLLAGLFSYVGVSFGLDRPQQNASITGVSTITLGTVSNNSFLVSWTVNRNATGYDLYRSISTTSTPQFGSTPAFSGSVTKYSQTFTKADSGKYYSYKVRGWSRTSTGVKGYSQYSAVVTKKIP